MDNNVSDTLSSEPFSFICETATVSSSFTLLVYAGGGIIWTTFSA